jgi:colanic acid/amylovoran biosynthesis protein
LLSKIKQTIINKIESVILQVRLSIVIFENTCIFYCLKKPSSKEIAQKNNIIIVGGELFNKGAQAMTFTVIDRMKRIKPHSNIFLFSNRDFFRKDEEKAIYSFTIMPWNLETKLSLLNYLRIFRKKNQKCLQDSLEKIIKDAEYFIDVSGYALGSAWGWLKSIDYLLNIAVAKKYSVPYYIFPQSIGPFNYRFIDKLPLNFLMKSYLKYPNKIFCREKEGLSSLYKFTKNNIERAYDIVLQGQEYDLSNIYIKKPYLKNIKIESNSVAIIPNTKVIERIEAGKLYSTYISIIDKLINAGKKIYILRHSFEDIDICKKMKQYYPDNGVLELIPDDLNAIELERVVKQFDLIVASRYHSIIHAYKNGIPVLVIGWATKYRELLDTFGQSEYHFDVRGGLDDDKVNLALDKLLSSYQSEKKKIIDKMSSLAKCDVYGTLI